MTKYANLKANAGISFGAINNKIHYWNSYTIMHQNQPVASIRKDGSCHRSSKAGWIKSD